MLTKGRLTSPFLFCCLFSEVQGHTEVFIMYRQIKYSFKQWCIDNGQMELLNRFNTRLNQCLPDTVSCGSHKKMWFDCPYGKHTPNQFYLYNVIKNPEHNSACPYCKSMGNLYPEIWDIWSDKNDKTPYDFTPGSECEVWVKCHNGVHEDTQRHVCNIVKYGFKCPQCNPNYRVFEDLTKKQFGRLTVVYQDTETQDGNGTRWWCHCSCHDGEDNPPLKSVLASHLKSGKIQSCGCLHNELMTGENNWCWKGGISPERVKLRESDEYYIWRNAVGTRDKFTCQCCGTKTRKVEAHHLFSFIQYEDLRYDVRNGLCLCRYCHNTRESGSFHNVYGTHNNTPNQLREYILNKSGVDIYQTHPEILELISNTTK